MLMMKIDKSHLLLFKCFSICCFFSYTLGGRWISLWSLACFPFNSINLIFFSFLKKLEINKKSLKQRKVKWRATNKNLTNLVKMIVSFRKKCFTPQVIAMLIQRKQRFCFPLQEHPLSFVFFVVCTKSVNFIIAIACWKMLNGGPKPKTKKKTKNTCCHF